MTTSVNVVETKYGKVRGKRVSTQNGTTYYAYYGIPYAKAPVGDLRFRSPVSPDSWVEIRDATNALDKICVQVAPFNGDNIMGQEDCLALNVFSPIVESNKQLPVMVFIHGGGFIEGSNDTEMLGPDFLLDDRVLLVCINYRLGILGFLNLDLPEAQGNMGLKDQVFALKWVQDNISAFNGNPENVTIFGISAGGASVELHCLSPMSEGLFHRAIIQSGSFLNPWAHNYDIKDYTYDLAKNMDLKFNDTKELLQVLKALPAKDLVLQASTVSIPGKATGGLHFGFVPSLEKIFPGHEAFLTENTLETLKSGDCLKVPIITGFCRDEGLIVHATNPEAYKTVDQYKDFFKHLPFTLTASQKIKFEDRFRQAYLHNIKNDEGTVSPATGYFTDVDFLGGIHMAATLISRKNPNVYFYEFAYDGELNFLKKFLSINMRGSCHADDSGYIFKIDILPNGTEVDKLVRSRLVRMWTNFAKFGNPTPEVSELLPTLWKPIAHDRFQFLVIDDKLTMSKNLYPARMALHQDLYNTSQLHERFYK